MMVGSPNRDVVVVGAGPAGAACALRLAENGMRVVLVEKEPLPRYKTCGGGLVWRARGLLDVDIDEIVEHTAFRADLLLEERRLAFEVARAVPLVSMIMRSELDQRLVSAARGAGAELRSPCMFQGLTRQAGAVAVRTDRGDLAAAFVVAADGAAGPTAPAAGWRPNPGLIPALETEVSVPPAMLDRFAGRARFDFGPVPAGYAWIFPKRRHLSIGCLSFRRRKPGLRRRLENYLAALGLGSPSSRQDHGFVIPVAPRPGPCARGRILLVGDAAGLADPVTCEGIYHALLSGQLAAEAILRHAPDAARVASAYRRSLSTGILPELRRARLMARLLYRMPRLRRLAFSRLGQALCEAVADVVCGELTYRELLASSPIYLRALLWLAKRRSID